MHYVQTLPVVPQLTQACYYGSRHHSQCHGHRLRNTSYVLPLAGCWHVVLTPLDSSNISDRAHVPAAPATSATAVAWPGIDIRGITAHAAHRSHATSCCKWTTLLWAVAFSIYSAVHEAIANCVCPLVPSQAAVLPTMQPASRPSQDGLVLGVVFRSKASLNHERSAELQTCPTQPPQKPQHSSIPQQASIHG